MLEKGSNFPNFTLPDQNDNTLSLESYVGKWLVVYFYPKDNTSGCSAEASDFASLHDNFIEQGAEIIGVSADSVKSHCKFATKFSLPFSILSDQELLLLQACGVWQKKKMCGKEYMGIVRSTFLVDPEGKIRALWPKVSVKGHAEEVLDALKKLKA